MGQKSSSWAADTPGIMNPLALSMVLGLAAVCQAAQLSTHNINANSGFGGHASSGFRRTAGGSTSRATVLAVPVVFQATGQHQFNAGVHGVQTGFRGNQAGFRGNQVGFNTNLAGFLGNQVGFNTNQAGFRGNQAGFGNNFGSSNQFSGLHGSSNFQGNFIRQPSQNFGTSNFRGATTVPTGLYSAPRV